MQAVDGQPPGGGSHGLCGQRDPLLFTCSASQGSTFGQFDAERRGTLNAAQEDAMLGALRSTALGEPNVNLDSLFRSNDIPAGSQASWRLTFDGLQDILDGSEGLASFDTWLEGITDIPPSSQEKFATLRQDVEAAVVLSQVASQTKRSQNVAARAVEGGVIGPEDAPADLAALESVDRAGEHNGERLEERTQVLNGDASTLDATATSGQGTTGRCAANRGDVPRSSSGSASRLLAWSLKHELAGGPAQHYRGPLSAATVLRLLDTVQSEHARQALTGASRGYLQYFHYLGLDDIEQETAAKRRGPTPKGDRAKVPLERWQCRVCYAKQAVPAKKTSNLGAHLYGDSRRRGCLQENLSGSVESVAEPARDATGQIVKLGATGRRRSGKAARED
ncbi:hypothetical protein OC834_006078 [Tilletia horrida]|nr:hypothetical protein OC834_006078 [Tilletia horrida]